MSVTPPPLADGDGKTLPDRTSSSRAPVEPIADAFAAASGGSDGLSASAPASARLLSVLASVSLGFVLPALMAVANKSAPATLGAAALFANAAAVLGGRGPALATRYRTLLGGAQARVTGAVVLVLAVSLGWSIDRSMTLRGLVEGMPELAFALAVAAAWPLVVTLRHVHWLLLGIVGAVLLIAFERFAGMPLHRLLHERGEAWDLKRSAIPPVLLLWPAMGFCFTRGQRLAAFGLCCMAAAGVLIAHSGAPGFALIAALIALLAAIRFPRATIGCSALVLGILLAVSAFTGTLGAYLPASVREGLSEEHAFHRVQIWTAFERRVHDRPLLGHGFDTSFKVSTAPRPDGTPPAADNDFMRDNHPHNVFLQLWVELGLLGALAAAAASAFVLSRLYRMNPRALPTRLALLVSVVGIGLVGLSAWQPWWVATIAASLLWFDLLADRAERRPDAAPARR